MNPEVEIPMNETIPGPDSQEIVCICSVFDEISKRVNLVFKDYFNRPYFSKSLSLYCDIYEVGLRLKLDNYWVWVAILEDKTLLGNKRDFVYDTMRFISGEPRVLSIDNWMKMLDFNRYDPSDPNLVFKFKPMPRYFTGNDILLKWIRRENGLEDMVISMRILTMLINFSELKR